MQSSNDALMEYRLIDFQTKDDMGAFIIEMYGINEAGDTVYIKVNDFEPFFYILVDDTWTNDRVNKFITTTIAQKVKNAGNTVKGELCEFNKLYWFAGDKKSRFVRLSFNNMATYYKVRNIWYDKTGKKTTVYYKTTILQIYETKIPPLLRFFHINKISPSGWVRLNANCKQSACDVTTCTYEYICSSDDIIPLPEKETRVPYKIASFDIEASSSHGDFPLPVKTYKKLAQQIVDIINKRIDTSVTTNCEPDVLKKTLKRIIMTAFGYDKYENVEKVYPKIAPPSKEHAIKLIDRFLNNPIVVDGKINKLSKTESVLSEWISANTAKLSGPGGDDDDDGDDDAGEAGMCEVIDTDDTKVLSTLKESCYVIMDILLNMGDTRENKIAQLNESLMAVFPELEGDKVTFIGTTFCRFGEKEPYLNNCLVLGSCDDIAGVDVQTFDRESDLLLAWTQLIQDENPDIIIGYNIFGFDYEFLYQRACQNECEQDFLELSRKRGDVCAKFDGYDDSREIVGIESTKVVLASGEYDLRYVKMAGRIQIDMYAYLRRDFNLSSYKLDDVAGQFICDEIKKVEYRDYDDATVLTTGNLTGIHVGDYIHIEIVGITTNYIEGGKKYHIVDITANTIVISDHISDTWWRTNKLRWGIAKDDVSPQDIFRLANGSSTDRAIIGKYCLQDCNLVHHLLNKIDVITGYVEMSNICSVPISFLVFRGQGIKLTSYVAKKCREKDTLIPDLDSAYGNDEGYEGAIVLAPKCSMYMDNPVACVDYASLYPASMISNNLSPDSKVWTQEYDLDGTLLKEDCGTTALLPVGYDYVDVEFDTFKWRRLSAKSRATKVKTGKKICRFAQFPDGRRAILPAILEELLKARADTRKRIKTEPDAFMRNILDKRQLAYKVTANSLYGQCGSKTSTFFEKDVAAATTATGRMMIIYAKRIIEEVYGDLVYNTKEHGPVCCRAEYVYGDSVAKYTPVFVRFNGCDTQICTIESLCAVYGNGVWIKCTELGKQTKEVCNFNGVNIETWSDKGWTRLHRIIRHPLARHKKMYRILTHTGLVDVTDDHSLLTPEGTILSPKNAIVGTPLMHHWQPTIDDGVSYNTITEIMKKLFSKGILSDEECTKLWKLWCYVNSDHDHLNDDIFLISFEKRDQLTTAYLFWLANLCGWQLNINTNKENTDVHYYKISGTPFNKKVSTTVRDIYQISYPDGEYVYDLTTDNHHFSAGIGNLIVHNTDSVFFTFNLQSPLGEPIRGKPALEITIEIAQDVAKVCSQYLKAPMELTYEKTLMPFILLSKKRYVGMLYEDSAKGDGKLKYMGLSIKRRDSCDYLKEVYGRILSILMKEQDVMLAVNYLTTALQQLIDGGVPLDKLIITRALRSDYKNPQQIAHRVLADRIGERDPGNKPKSGDRIKYLFIQPVLKGANIAKGRSVLMGDRVETPEFIMAGKAQIDYTHYVTNQLMNPMTQLFGLALLQIYSGNNKNKNTIAQYNGAMAQLKAQYGDDLEGFNKQKEKYCSREIEKIVFEPILMKIQNRVNRQPGIMQFMGGK